MIKDNLANILTLFRLILLPFIIILFYIPFEWAAWLCLGLYILGAVTDFLDGWVARKFDQITEFGKFMDPISDKIFVVVILLMLVATSRIHDGWVLSVIIILVREFLVAGMREFLGPKEIKLPVTNLAKWKTTIQMLATGLLIVGPYIPAGHITGLLGLCVAAGLTAYTGWVYLKTGFAYLKG
jgi:CDP-diacylglycerol--glycerol-3-phosphate 3-phosphatidyltransferase